MKKAIMIIFAAICCNIVLIDLIFKGLSASDTFINIVSFMAIPFFGIVDYYVFCLIKMYLK